MGRLRKQGVLNEEVGLQIAPMIDVTMLLLFFFMLSTTLENKRTPPQIKVPITKHPAESSSRKSSIVVVICKTGDAIVNGRITRQSDLHSEIARQVNTNETANFVGEIQADAHTDGATIKKVISAFCASGIREVSYAVQNN